MPQIKSAKKRVAVAARQTAQNRLHKTRSRTAVKRVRALLAEGKAKEAAGHFSVVQKYLDKAAKTNAIHPNNAARTKARLAQALKAAGNQDPVPAVPVPTKTSKPKKAVSSAAKKPAPKARKKTAAPKKAAPKAKKP